MTLYMVLTQDGRIQASAPEMVLTDAVPVEVPLDFDMEQQHNYRVVEGVLVAEPWPTATPTPDLLEVLEARLDYIAMMVGVELYE